MGPELTKRKNVIDIFCHILLLKLFLLIDTVEMKNIVLNFKIIFKVLFQPFKKITNNK